MADTVSPLLGSVPSRFARVPTEILEIIFKYTGLITEQVKIANLLCRELGAECMIYVLMHSNKHSLFRNRELSNYIFSRPAFNGDTANPNLRPTKEDPGNENGDFATYPALINAALRIQDYATANILRATREARLVRHRAAASLKSRERRLGLHKPPRALKIQLGLHLSKEYSYTKWMSVHASHPTKYHAIKHARDNDRDEGLKTERRIQVIGEVLDAVANNMDKYRDTCRGCLGTETLDPSRLKFCSTCFVKYCNLYEIDSRQFRVDLSILLSPTDKQIWFKPKITTTTKWDPVDIIPPGVVLLSYRDAAILKAMIFRRNFNRAEEKFDLDFSSIETRDTIGFRFRTVLKAVIEARKQYALARNPLSGSMQGSSQLDLSEFGLSNTFFRSFAAMQEVDVDGIEFLKVAWIMIAGDYDETKDAARANLVTWLRRAVARFWHLELYGAYKIYTNARVYELFSIKPVEEWTYWMQPPQAFLRDGVTTSVAHALSLYTHGVPCQHVRNISESTQQENLSQFIACAAVTVQILNSYDPRVIKIFMDLLALICNHEPAFDNFMRIMMSWLRPRTGHLRNRNYTSIEGVDKHWCQDRTGEFWVWIDLGAGFQAKNEIGTVYSAFLEWSRAKRIVIIVPADVDDLTSFPHLLHDLVSYGLVRCVNEDDQSLPPPVMRTTRSVIVYYTPSPVMQNTDHDTVMT